MKTKLIGLATFLTCVFANAAIPRTTLPKPSSVVNPEEIRAVIRIALPSIKDCYQDIRDVQPNVEGKVVIRFTVGDKGKVTEAVVKSTEAKYPPLENCVMQVIRAQKFPSVPKGDLVEIDYPFIFSYDKNSNVVAL